jgi:putative transcriptional regulator
MELTLVLQGAFQDEDGYYGRGDIEIASQDVYHTPVADISEDCICLAVTDAPLKFKGLIPRLAQPFLGL